MRSTALLLGTAALVLLGVACGRPLPEQAPVPTGPAQTGAFEEPEPVKEGAIRAAGAPGAPHDYLAALADAFAAVDPAVRVRLAESEPDLDALCAGELEVVAARGDSGEDTCPEAAAFLVAEGVVLHVNRESLLQSFEVESLVQQAVDTGEALPQEVGLEPLPIEALQQAQTKLEQVIAGVG